VALAQFVAMFGVFFLRPAIRHCRADWHKTHKVQLEIVSVLCLISLFTQHA